MRSLHLPHGAHVQYTHQGPWLNKINAGSYEHTYNDFDLSGKPKSSTLIGKAGPVQYRYNLQGQALEIKSQAWKEEINVRNSLGYLLKRTITDPCEALTYHYTYDSLGQLASETQPTICHYRCDSWNNVTHKNDKPWSRNALHQLLAHEEGGYTYDPNGNRQTKTTTTGTVRYIYDAQDRLVQVLSPHQKAEYTYDESNRRLSKTLYSPAGTGWHKEKTERYLYQGHIEIGCYDEEDRLISYRLLGRNDQAIAVEIGNEIYAPVHDHLGHVSALIYASDGTVFETYRYSAFGEEQIFDSWGQQKAGSSNPWRYAGKRKDEETGFIYFGLRYYDPVAQSWITPDPIGREGGPNLYAYVLNNPLYYFDQLGLWSESYSEVDALIDFEVDRLYDEIDSRGNSDSRDDRSDNSTSSRESRGFVDCMVSFFKGVCDGLLGRETTGNSGDHWEVCSRWDSMSVGERCCAIAGIGGEIAGFAATFVPIGRGLKICSAIAKSKKIRNALKTVYKIEENCTVVGKISGYTKHGLNQVIGRNEGRGVKIRAILDSLKNPTKCVSQPNGSIKYIGKDATVILNTEQKIVTAYGQPRGPQIWEYNKIIQPK